MNYEIINLQIKNELDIVLAHKRARQIAEFTGMPVPRQTKFATAISEICRNVIEHAGEGKIHFSIVEKDNDLMLEAKVVDFGIGIRDLDAVMNFKPLSAVRKGMGIYNARKLVQNFEIVSNEGRGTKVIMRKSLPVRRPLINRETVEKWKEYFENETEISPYEEIKNQNIQLLDMMEVLQNKNIEIEKQIEEIAVLNNDLDQFAYTISHDLKAPLKNIEALAALVEEGVREGNYDELESVCGMINNQLQKMDQFIEEVLSYSTVGKKKIKKENIAVQKLVEEVVGMLVVPEKMKLIIHENMPVLEGEIIFLKQIFGNLISNALKYHDKTIGEINIGTRPAEGGFYAFYVEDDGPGIAKIHQEKIFDIFESLSGAKNNSGIGLSIVKKIIDEKGGKVWVESEGRGSTFVFTWPMES